VPGLLTYHIFFWNIIGGSLNSNIARNFFRLGFAFIFFLFIISHINIWRFCYGQRTLKISSARGDLYVFKDEKDYRLRELIDFMRENTKKSETLAVFPEGPALNFFSERRNPLYYYDSIDIIGPQIIGKIISQTKEKKVDYVVLRTEEPGRAIFGRDYGNEIVEYVIRSYSLFKQFGPLGGAGSGYRVKLYKRNA
jgi:hypothetical protein